MICSAGINKGLRYHIAALFVWDALRIPLDAGAKAMGGALDLLDDAVISHHRAPQPLPHPVNRLMIGAVDGEHPRGCNDLGRVYALLDLLDRSVSDKRADVLDEGDSLDHIEHLHALADAQQRQVARKDITDDA